MNVDYTQQSPTILSLCSGGLLGLERGFDAACERLNWQPGKTIAYVEIEAFIIENLVRQMEQGLLDPAPVWSNVKTFLPIAKRLRGKVDWIFGGYPCQPFSLTGKRQGTEDPRHLWPYIGGNEESIISAIKPMGCLFENVTGHISLGYEEVRADLERIGYTVKEGIFSAEEIGAPHLRQRLFILAIRKELANAYSNEQASVRGNVSKMSGIPEAKRKPEFGSSLFGGTSPELDHSMHPRLERYSGHENNPQGWQIESRSAPETGFPMGQGFDQYDWEAPRVKSRMGVTVNGYDFTEDLLRMAGNGVVWQTAELAFLTLLKKFNRS